MLRVCIPAIFLNKVRLEGFRIMCIDDGTIGLLEVANKKLEHPDLHLEPRLLFVPFHHFEKSRGNLANFLRLGEIQIRRGLTRLGVVQR